ncbi:hypothetical protein [Streptomyces flavofungini]|uniref:hypothetical protein n=1 Tax=Streptomyces flavofungini TaxID=68200 RepID=UPI0034DDF671
MTRAGLSEGAAEVAEGRLRHLPRTAARARRGDLLARILLDFGFLQAKLDLVGVRALLTDFGLADGLDGDGTGRDGTAPPTGMRAAQRDALALLRRTLWAAEPALARDPAQLAAQLLGRLGDEPSKGLKELEALLRAALRWRGRRWLRPLHCSLAGERGNTRLLRSGTGTVTALLLTGARHCLTATEDGTLEVWDIRTGEVPTRWAAPDGVECATADPDGNLLVTGAADGTVSLWRLDVGRCLRTFTPHRWEVGQIALLPGGQALSASHDGTLAVWDITDGTVRARLRGHTGWVRTVAVDAAGRVAVSGATDGSVRVWDVPRGRQTACLVTDGAWVNAVAVSACGHWAASGAEAGPRGAGPRRPCPRSGPRGARTCAGARERTRCGTRPSGCCARPRSTSCRGRGAWPGGCDRRFSVPARGCGAGPLRGRWSGMGTMTSTAVGTASPETAWRRYVLLDEWPRWAPHIKGVRVDGPRTVRRGTESRETVPREIRPGLTGHVESVVGVRAAFVVESVDHDRREWVWRVRSGPLRLRLHHGVRPHPRGSATWLTMRGPVPVLAAYTPLARLALGRLVRD